jgi:hypothetical protein
MNFKLFLLLLPLNSMAQPSDCDSIRFEMIRETVNFLATDSKISTDVRFKVACTEQKYLCLEANINEKKLHGVLAKVRIWDQKKTGNTSADIQKIKSRLIADVAGSPDKVYRKNMPGYWSYISKMDALLAKVLKKSIDTANSGTSGYKAAVQAVAPKTTEQNLYSSVRRKGAASRPETTSATTDTAIQDTAETNLEIINQNSTKKVDMEINLAYVALAAAIIAIVISFLALMKKPPRSKRSYPPSIDSGAAAHSDRFGPLEGSIKEVIAQLETLKRSVGLIDKRLYELEEKPTVVEFDMRETRVATQPPVHRNFALPESRLSTQYAKFSDLDNGGFSPAMLVETQNGEQTYKITINGDQATYEVSDDLKAQKYALQNYEYLSKACQIRNPPQPGSNIYTLSPGVLNRSAGQDWLIEKQAEIEFR